MADSQQTRQKTPEENFRELYKRTAELNDKVSALLSPAWGSEMGILPTEHPLYQGEKPSSAQEEQGAPVDWQAIVERRERDLKKVDMARYLAEQERDEARQWARHGYEIGQKHCGWSDHGVAPAWLTEGWPPHIDSCEHLKQMAEFDEALARVRAARDRMARGRDVDAIWCLDLLDAALNGTGEAHD